MSPQPADRDRLLADLLDDLATDVCALAQKAGMPPEQWLTNDRIARACRVLGMTPEEARATDWYAPARGANPSADVPVTAAAAGPLEVWTDGACRHNPGPGGWGWVSTDGREGSGAEADTTNQRMELRAALEALRAVQERPIVVVSDSSYLVDGFTKKWWAGWLKRDWTNSQGKPVANRDLWEPLIDLVVFGGVTRAQNPHRSPVDSGVSWRWVKGHAGYALNEAADALAVAARETLPGGTSRVRV